MARSHPELQAAFAEALKKERRDVRVAAASLTVLALLGTLLLAVFLAHENTPWPASALLAYVYLAFLLCNDTERRDRPWVAGAGLLLGPIAAAGFSPLPRIAPSLFWILFAAGALAGWGCLGMAYRWREPYYGLRIGPHRYDDPTTLRDDRDRAHRGLAAFAAPARLLVGGFADLAGRGWMREPLDARDVEAAVQLVAKLAVHDRADIERLLRPRVRLWLSKMGLIRAGEAGWGLTAEGEKLAGTHGVL